jgi:hypothetical protein
MLKLKGKPALVSCHKVAKISLLQSLEHWKQLAAFCDPDFSQFGCRSWGIQRKWKTFIPMSHADDLKMANVRCAEPQQVNGPNETVHFRGRPES